LPYALRSQSVYTAIPPISQYRYSRLRYAGGFGGISYLSIHAPGKTTGTATFTDVNIDTKLPVDDNALHPAMTGLPSAPQNVWTEMTSLVLIYMTSRATQELNRLLGTTGTIPSEANRREIITQLEAVIEVHIACYNPVIPAQRLTVIVARMIARKKEFVSRQQWLLSIARKKDQTGPLSHLANTITNDKTPAEACTIIEMSAELLNNDLLYNFRWCAEMHPQYSNAVVCAVVFARATYCP
jgi:hypothetical protein